MAENFCCGNNAVPSKPYYSIQTRKSPIGFTWHMKGIKNSCSMLSFFTFFKFLALWNKSTCQNLISHVEAINLDPTLPSITPSDTPSIKVEDFLRILRSFLDFINLKRNEKQSPEIDAEAFKILSEISLGPVMFDYSGTEFSNIFKYLNNYTTIILDFTCSCRLDFQQFHRLPLKVKDFITRLQTGQATVKCGVCQERNLTVHRLGCRASTIFVSFFVNRIISKIDLTKHLPKTISVYDHDKKKSVCFQLAYINLVAENSKKQQMAHTNTLFVTNWFHDSSDCNYVFYDSLYMDGRTLPVPDECCNVLKLLEKWIKVFSKDEIDSEEFGSITYMRVFN